jgi:hypothetical protein
MNDEDLKRVYLEVTTKLAGEGIPERLIRDYDQYRDIMYLMIQAGYIQGIRYAREVMNTIQTPH